MITRDEIIAYMEQKSYRPLGYLELKEALNVSEEDETAFARLLGRMEKEGDIVQTRKGKYGLPRMMNLVRGVISISPRGFGILRPDEHTEGEIFVYGRDLNGAMHHDRVMVRINRTGAGGQRPEGEVIRALERAHRQVVGTFRKLRPLPQVIPDDPRLLYPVYVKPKTKMRVNDGDKVLVEITVWPDKDRYPEGRIIEVLGGKGEPGLDVLCIIRKFQLRDEFPSQVVKEARRVAVLPGEDELAQRRDLREWKMVTIDGEDAKDLDDAVSIERTQGGYRLGVHIADVSHYVSEGGVLDKEAFRRGTSVYLTDRVLPMLPPELSNGICSLNAGEDRLAVSVVMDIDEKGEVRNYEIFKSVIRVKERMTYTDVNKILLENDPDLRTRYSELVPDFEVMGELCRILRKRRMDKGALDFDFPETKIIVDEKGWPVAVARMERQLAEMIIEEFMIKANEVVAEHLYSLKVPTLYRVHERPDEDSIRELNRVLGVFGHRVAEREVQPKHFQEILEKIKDRPEERTVSTIILRSMRHARYAPQPLGHFGLASAYYTHFTSPIRRYPDLVVHRVLTYLLEKGAIPAKKRTAWEMKMPLCGEHSTLREITAEEAERESADLKKAQYMKQFVGEFFDAVVSSVTSFGLFVELENTVEGLVHVSSMADDYYEFDDRSFSLTGRHTGKRFRIGDRVRVQLVNVNIDEAKIDFELAG
ncbi:MAG TPA: ribonuclease R [Syntrophothermus lipocalidus]|uniref:Ribonuclease R n=1 Tax=Syntrophothermus lipocalidus (strain DSM 12680 / TGB-C1) TaxID=643648 RepID=D7CPG2_SYNLT|nr:ribonuclease R [Syntrophothermus lipocalidus]ADI02597.1 ribonuclease R [Syntrophothermus lipocalidus DSM 12680]HHV76178.1 ribonuclease R [Syntrophothermus lipocalidus]